MKNDIARPAHLISFKQEIKKIREEIGNLIYQYLV